MILRVLPLIMRAIARLVSRTRSVRAAPGRPAPGACNPAPCRALAVAGADVEPVGVHGVAGTDPRQSPVRPELLPDRRRPAVDELGASGGPADVAADHRAGRQGGEEGPRRLFLPVAEHLKVPGIEAAGRVDRYPATAR